MIVELPCFFHNENTEVLENVGIDYELSSCEARDMLFVGSFSVAKYFEDSTGSEFSRIDFNGNSVICALTYDEVKEIIKTKV